MSRPQRRKIPQSKLLVFKEMSADKYPFTVKVLDAGTREVRYQETVSEAGVLRMPGPSMVNRGNPVIKQVEWPDGSVTEHYPAEALKRDGTATPERHELSDYLDEKTADTLLRDLRVWEIAHDLCAGIMPAELAVPLAGMLYEDHWNRTVALEYYRRGGRSRARHELIGQAVLYWLSAPMEELLRIAKSSQPTNMHQLDRPKAIEALLGAERKKDET